VHQRQKVLAVPSSGVSWLFERRKFYDDHFASFLAYFANNAVFVDREWAEKTDSVKQLVGCAVIANGDQLLCARRAKKSNRPSLALRWTLMFGGHVDDNDVSCGDPIRSCMLRELNEELAIQPRAEPLMLGLAIDPATEVGRLHLGVVFLVRADIDHVQMHKGLDGTEFVNARRRHLLQFADTQRLSAIHSFDAWSELFLNSSAGGKLTKVYRFQKELDLAWA
jgi:predicted NUDIX family phosphoesterase